MSNLVGNYLRDLERMYRYTGKWRPDKPISIGSYSPYESNKGYFSWLKDCFTSNRHEEINDVLHDYGTNVIDGLKVERGQVNTGVLNISCGVDTNVTGTAGEVELTATRSCGFYISLAGMYKDEVLKDNVIEQLRNRVNNENDAFSQSSSIAIVTSVTYGFGIIALFSKSGASLKLQNTSIPSPSSIKGLAAPTCHFETSHKMGNVIIFYSKDSNNPLIPFMDVYIADKRKIVNKMDTASNYLMHSSTDPLSGLRSPSEISLVTMKEFSYEHFVIENNLFG